MRKDALVGDETLSPHALGMIVNIDGCFIDADSVCSCGQWATAFTGDDPQEVVRETVEAWEAHRSLAWKAEGRNRES